MPLATPDIQAITNGSTGLDMQAWTDATDNQSERLAAQYTGVVSGMAVTQDTGSDMKIAIASGVFMILGVLYAYAGSGGSPITIAAADADDRRDIVTIDSAGTVTVTKGTDCTTAGWTRSSSNLPPVKPAIPTTAGGGVYDCLLAEVSVPEGTTEITTAVNIVGYDPTALILIPKGWSLGKTTYGPSGADPATPALMSSGLAALNFSSGGRQSVTFIAPPSATVKVRGQCFLKGGAAAAQSIVLGVVSSTGTPGTFVGSTLAWLTPTATAGDDGMLADFEITISSGLSAGTSYTWYLAGGVSAADATVIAQEVAANTTTPTGAPAYIEVLAA